MRLYLQYNFYNVIMISFSTVHTAIGNLLLYFYYLSEFLIVLFQGHILVLFTDLEK